MSDVKQPLMADYKDSALAGTESLPVYRIDETGEQLIVGQEAKQKSCAIGRFFSCNKACNRSANGEEPPTRRFCFKNKRRAFIWIFAFLALLFVGGKFVAHTCSSAFTHAIECSPITGLTTTLTLPLGSDKTRVFLHGSLTTGDSHIVHSDDVKEGTIQISFTLPDGTVIKGDEDDKPSLFVCQAAKDRFVGAGIHNREKGAETPKVVSTTVTLSKNARNPPIFMPGEREHRHGFMHKRIMKAVRKAEMKAIAKIEKARAMLKSSAEAEESWEVVDA